MKPRGFTLLEVAVALAILGMGVVTCLQLFGSSLRMQQRASREARAVLHGRAAMDALLFQPDIRDHTEERTTAEGFRTQIVVRHAGSDEGIDKKELDFVSDMALRYLEVTVWPEGNARPIVFKSMRVAPENE
jgi:prepilin-type N-terminal cleavage/methylation domain-containing protein